MQGLGGHITTSSEVGNGLKYNIEFPIYNTRVAFLKSLKFLEWFLTLQQTTP
jgi:hypothetical protein